MQQLSGSLLGQPVERPDDSIDAVVVDDNKCIAKGWQESASHADVQRTEERDDPVDIDLIELGACGEAAEFNIEHTYRTLRISALDPPWISIMPGFLSMTIPQSGKSVLSDPF